MDRRTFLAGGAAIALAPGCSLSRPGPRTLRAAPARQFLAGTGHPDTAVWSYGGTVPGPELRFRQGDRVRVAVENALADATTVHWHGIRLPNAMDGVPGLTQPPIAANGGRFAYEFELPDAGTYWYHPHLGNPEQVSRGLYGALIVEEREPPAVDRDAVWVLSDWELDRQGRIDEAFTNPMAASHDGRVGNTVTVNGVVRDGFQVRAGERIRLRLINAASARIFGLTFEGHAPTVIALDGHPVAPHPAPRVVLGPGMRADLILDCTARPASQHRVIDNFYRQNAYELLKLTYSGDASLRTTFAPVVALPANPVARPQVGGAEKHRIVFGGGAMGRVPDQARHKGMFWTVNGEPMADHHDHHGHPPLLQLSLRRSYLLELVNDTAWHHPIHLHGHTFRVLARNGKALEREVWSDTVLLEPKSRAEIAFVADNPGSWMFHCHVLEHQATGMAAVVSVS
jgi:FtsP/CotA-like multicopper oxidase with cupredoxin domain